MKVNSIRKSKIERILQDVKIALWAILTLFFVVVTVMEALFAGGAEIAVQEPITVSSAAVNNNGILYTSSITGVLVNNGDTPITVERLTIMVSGGKREDTVTVNTPMLLPPRNFERIYYTWESHAAYDSVDSVRLTVDGEVQNLYNLPEQSSMLPMVICLAFAALSGWLLSRAVRVRRYMQQESKLPADM